MIGESSRRRQLPRGRIATVLGALAFTLTAFTACGNFTFDNPPATTGGDARRTYVNDSAAADSLNPGVVRTGIKFVLQPNKTYKLSVLTSRTDDQLAVFYYDNGVQGQYQTLKPSFANGKEIFSLVSDHAAAQWYLGQLVVQDGIGAINRIHHVSLVSEAPIGKDTLNLRLIFIRTLQGMADSTAKANFATNLFADMAAIYVNYGIVLKGSIEIVEPTLAREVFPFTNTYVPLPGTRIKNNAHLYLVDTISVPNSGSGLVGEVLGFAPREVVDIDQHRESRVILANPYNAHASIAVSTQRLAVTATHELGHFFGLRHTVSTRHDLLQDDDFSNTQDGFTDTDSCNLDQNLAKRSATAATAETDLRGPGGLVYCLRIADNSCNAGLCDLSNLMHPVDCGSLSGVKLSVEQVDFFKKNLATYRH